MMKLFKSVLATVKDIATNPDKYRKAAVVPAAVVVYLVSTYLGASSSTTLEVISTLAALGVYKVPNKTS